MVNFVKKRLQVFISSTYTDLLEERQAAVEAILTAGHFPAGMELFTAGDEAQMNVIKQWIDESDVYLLILGGRYGSIEQKSGKSYTHLEYEYALAQGKSLFACVLTDQAIDNKVKNSGRSVLEDEEPKKLKEFRGLVLSKLVKMCDDKKDIKIAVGETLANMARNESLVGWVRADNSVDVSRLADEIARLSQENAILRSQAPVGPEVGGMTFDEVTEHLRLTDSLDIVYLIIDELLVWPTNQPITQADIPKLCTKSMEELAKIGIIALRAGGMIDISRFELTTDGRAYLSKLRAMLIKDGRLQSEHN